MPSTPSKRLRISSVPSSTEVLVSLNSPRLLRRCLTTPLTPTSTSSMPPYSLPSLNSPLTNNSSMNLPLKELLNSSRPLERTSRTDGKSIPPKTPMPFLSSTNKKRDSPTTSPDLKAKLNVLLTKLMDSTSASEPNPQLPKPHPTSSKETNNFGIRPTPYVEPSITSTTMPPNPEDKNSPSSKNSKSSSRRDSLKLKMRPLRSRLTSKMPSTNE